MNEIRIYYECLEQAHDYIKPYVDDIAKNFDVQTALIKRPKKPEQLPRGSVYAIQSLTTPDILITGVISNKECPIVLIEFTEAVITEDHELQRSYGAIAAYLSGIYYIKVSGFKKSEKDFGGAEYNPFNTPKILIEKFNYEGFIIAEWQTEGNDVCNLRKNSNLPGCPPEITILKDTIQDSLQSFLRNQEDWYRKSLSVLKVKTSYKIYREKVEKADGSEKLLESWKERERKNKNPNSLRFFVNKDWIGAKINRFSHAMDPDRGILIFISFIFSQQFNSVFGIYALVRQRSTDVLKKKLTSLSSLRNKLNEALEKDGGVPGWFVKELKQAVANAKSKEEEINFQPVWEKYKENIVKNKVLMTIAFFLDGVYLNHNGIRLYWDRYKLLGKAKGNFIDLLKDYFGFADHVNPAPVEEINAEIDEDEVTYVITHKVLLPNKFRIVSISYPGSQGGGAILPEPKKGKAQPREYPDIVALPPEKVKEFDVLLNESKGMFNQIQVEEDSKKLLKYKKEKKMQGALKNTLLVAKVIDEKDNIRNIVVGVSFGVKNNMLTTWKPSEIDFIFRIVARKEWAIGIFNQKLKDLIPIIQGETNLPKVYRVKFLSENDGLQQKMFK